MGHTIELGRFFISRSGPTHSVLYNTSILYYQALIMYNLSPIQVQNESNNQDSSKEIQSPA